MNKYIISICGKIASGKETLGMMLRDELGPNVEFVFRRFSDSLTEGLQLFGVPNNRENLQKLSRQLRDPDHGFGETILASAMQQWIIQAHADVIYIDGVRRPADMYILQGLQNSFLIFIDAPQEIRYERLKRRRDRPGDAEKTWEDFLREDNAESEQQIMVIAKKANVRIDNSGSVDDLRRQIKKFIVENLKLV